MLGYKELQQLLTNEAMDFPRKWPIISSNLKEFDITLLDLLKVMPSSASAQIVMDYAEQYRDIVKIFKDSIPDKNGIFVSFKGFSDTDLNMLYKSLRMGEFEGVEELGVHCFIMNQILPKALFSLLRRKKTNLNSVFFTLLSYDEFVLLALGPQENTENAQFGSEASIADEYWIGNAITLIRKLDYFIQKAYTKEKPLFEETRAFLLDFKAKIDEDAIMCLNLFPALRSKLRDSIDETLTAMENIERNNFDNFNRIILSKLKAKTFASIDTRLSLKETSADFEKDYPNKEIAIQYLRKQLNNPEFLFETVENIGKRLDRILLARRTDKMNLFQEIVSLLRFNDLLICEASLVDERYSLLSRITLWRLFSFCLYSEYAPIALGYIIRQFEILGPKIDKQHKDYIYSLFCYLYVMDERRVCEKPDRNQENKKVVLTLLEMFLSKTDLKKFCRANFFLSLDFEDESLTKKMKNFIEKNNDLNATFNDICDELIDSKAFRDKSLLIIAFARKVLLNLYINPQNNENDQDSKLRLYATLMLLFDISDLQKIDKEINPHNYLLFETRLKLIIECFGLIGAYPRSESRKINEIHLNSENPALSPLNKDSRPTDLIKFLQTYVEENMFYKNINLFAVFKTLQSAELQTKDIQHSRLFCEKVHLDSAENPFDLIKWICRLAINIKTEFYFAFEMTLEILIGSKNDLGFTLVPFILCVFLQNCSGDDINGLTADINKILDKGVSLHQMILINTIKQLEKWHFESLQYLKSTQQSQADEKGASGSHKVDEFAIKMENFSHHFTQIKRLIDMNKLIKAQADFGDYKSAALNLEKLLEYMLTSDNQINDTECAEKLGLLYSIYGEINEDYKDISFENILQKLRIVYDPSKIPMYVSQITKEPNTINPVKRELIYNDEKSALISDSNIEAMTYIFSRKKVPLNDDSMFFSLLASLVTLSCHLMRTAPEYTTILEELKARAEEIFSNAKLSLIFSLLMIKNNYRSLYAFFLKAQILMDFEILFKAFRYTCKYACEINPNLVQSMAIERENFDISLDEMNEYFFMHIPSNEDSQSKIILFINTCLTRIEKRLKTFEAHDKLKLDWMNIVKFIINLMRENVKYYFDSIYFKFLYKLLKFTYDNNDYSRAEIYHKRLIDNVDVLRRPTKCRFLLAKLTRKLKRIKAAIEMLDEIKTQVPSEKIFEIKAQLRIAKYMQVFYAEAAVNEKYRQILSQYKSTCQNEVMYFKYAKFLERINPNPEVKTSVEIVRYYLESIKYGHEYIFQSLQRALRIWLDYCLPGLANKTEVNQIVEKALTQIETYKLVHMIQFLVSRLDHPDDDAVKILIRCLSRIAQEYPGQSVWWLLPLKYFNFKGPQGDYRMVSRHERAMQILNNVQKLNADSWRIINNADPFYQGLLDFAGSKDSIPPVLLQEMENSNIILPLRKYLDPILPKKNSVPDPNFNPFHSQPKYIQNMEPKFVTMQSKEMPKRITFKCTDGSRIPFLIKYEPKGDVRKESRTIDYVNFVNLYLQNSTLIKDKSFKVKTFSNIPLCSRINLSEWVDNTATIRSIIEREWKSNGILDKLSEIFCRFQSDQDKNQASSKFWEEAYRLKPVFHYFFWNNFGDPNDWYDASLSYVKTTALWSAFGYLIGLGDRHCENILLDKGTGEIVHIDFDCIFHKGKYLGIPEIVEFRLTRNIEAPMGAFKCYGLFEYYFKVACKVFQKNIDDILGALDSFVHDPLLEQTSAFDPYQTIQKIRKRIMFSQHKNFEEEVHQIIENSKDERCLKDMYLGWMPYM